MASDRNMALAARLGGLAAAVGAGTVIACSVAAPAWAAEDGTTASSAASETSKDSGSAETASPSSREGHATKRSERTEQAADAGGRATDDGDDAAEDTEQHTTKTRIAIGDDDEPTGDTVTTKDTEPPAAGPAVWSLLGTARRSDDAEDAADSADAAPTSQAGTGHVVEPVAAQTESTSELLEDGPEWESLYTGEPSWFHNVVTAGLNVLKVVFKPLGGLLRYTSLKIPIFTDGVPPFFVRPGLDVERTEFEGMKVWSLAPRENKTDKVVVALHGGSYEGQVNVFQWSTYAVMARDTGATVVVPLYELAPKGTAATEVPRTANFITTMIDEHGAENVSVLGDSAGGGLALAALQEVARRNSRQPSRLVLLAPWLDVSMSDPRSEEIKDPLLDIPNLARPGAQWAGPAGTADPMASPLFGSLDGLPPTYVYSSSRDLLTVDTLRLRDRVLAEGIPDVTFRLRAGLIHDWYIFPFLPDARAERPNVYADLLGSPVSAPAFLATK
ncbi:alpha/beta hydrolase [Mycobacterium sp. 236(2023)]|uniref:alpha/beta hydrolase fold domain-containing protein n=1 Tax=Mycobacterium sp. 236(2023) TaxID=3038163 RepID=UPI0024156B5C|nr:alpha/beta hydrolase [Mycobacterium sp. 236(2023)]MDG4664540.1 alpha/beta hydrolase [Mycobacterium sp. 236(2023)]